MFANKLIAVILSLVFYVQCQRNQKINVDLLYESLCPDSIRFINEQLYPSWPEISRFVDINFVPFGKSASINNGQKFICQHGPDECAGNKIQSCALSAITDPNDQVEFVHCFMNSFLRSDIGQECSKRVGLSWNYVLDCYQSGIGKQLQLQAEVLTHSIKPSFVPTILYNGVFNQEDQDRSLVNLKSVLCRRFKIENPRICG